MKIIKKITSYLNLKIKNMDKSTAIKRLDAIELEAKELRKIIEAPQKITDRVKDYKDILSISNVSESDDNVSIKGFSSEENELLKNIIRKIRVCKVYNEGWLPKRGERRWYNWYNVSSGFVFSSTSYDDACATTSSASRLCLRDEKLAKDFDNKFRYIDEAIIDIKD